MSVLDPRRVSPWFLLATLVLLGWFSFRILSVFLGAVVLGLFLAYVSYAPYSWIRARMRAGAAALVMTSLMTALFVLPLAILVLELSDEIRALARAFASGGPQTTVEAVVARLYQVAGVVPGEGAGRLADDLVRQVEVQMQALVRALPGLILEFLVGLFILLYVLYYAYKDGNDLLGFVRGILPMHEAHRDLLLHEVGMVLRGVLYGTVLTSLIQAVLGGLGFWALSIPNPVFWAVVMFLLAMLPVVGPPVVWAPWGLYLLAKGQVMEGIILLLYGALVVSTIDNLVRPKLIGRVAHVHPVVILLGVLGGIAVFGFIGFLLGPLILSLFVTVLRVYRKEFTRPDGDDGDRPLWVR